jgi:hypothetical protein
MSKLFQTVVNLQPVASLPGSASKGDMVVLDGDGHLYTHNGTAWVDCGAAGGGGGGGASGKTTINFGAYPGKCEASVDVTGQATIGAGAIVSAWIVADATADHSIEDHIIDAPIITAGAIVAGVGFTIFASAPLANAPTSNPLQNKGGRSAQSRPGANPNGLRSFGQWTVAWRWS